MFTKINYLRKGYYEESQVLTKGASQLGIEISTEKVEQLIKYLDMLFKWNKVHNLTAIDSFSDGVKKHLLDSLSLLKFIDQEAGV